VLYTLIETAKPHHVSPTRYLLEAVRAADRGEALLPWQLPSEQSQNVYWALNDPGCRRSKVVTNLSERT
jgi:hypothetical protein